MIEVPVTNIKGIPIGRISLDEDIVDMIIDLQGATTAYSPDLFTFSKTIGLQWE